MTTRPHHGDDADRARGFHPAVTVAAVGPQRPPRVQGPDRRLPEKCWLPSDLHRSPFAGLSTLVPRSCLSGLLSPQGPGSRARPDGLAGL